MVTWIIPPTGILLAMVISNFSTPFFDPIYFWRGVNSASCIINGCRLSTNIAFCSTF